MAGIMSAANGVAVKPRATKRNLPARASTGNVTAPSKVAVTQAPAQLGVSTSQPGATRSQGGMTTSHTEVTAAPARTVVFLAYEDMNLLDLAGPLQAFSTANRLSQGGGGAALYDTLVVSATGGSVMSSAGLAVGTLALAALDGVKIDTLISAGGCKGEQFIAVPELVDWIGRHATSVRRLCSVCTGAFLLAAAGQLHGRRVATHWAWAERLQRLHPHLEVDADALYVQDGAVWTSAGVTAGIDLSLALIEEDVGHALAIQVARQMVMFIKRTGGQSQFSAPLATQTRDKGNFAALHAWICAHIDADLSVARLAAEAGMSLRTFVRTYSAAVGRTPAKTVEAFRMEAACRALESTALPLKAICATVGYAEEQNLRRVFLRNFGISPLQYRARFSGRATPRHSRDQDAARTSPHQGP